MTPELKKRAWLLSAQLLDATLDAAELTDDLSDAEEHELREYMRKHIVEILRIVGRRSDESLKVVADGSVVVRLTWSSST